MTLHFIKLGHANKPFGIKGECIFQLYNSEKSTLKKGQKIFLYLGLDEESFNPKDLEGKLKEFLIESIRFGNKVVAKLQGIENRTDLEEILPFTIYSRRSDFPQIDNEDEFYYHDLIGMKVVHDVSNKEIGIVIELYDNGAQDILVIKTPSQKLLEVLFVEKFVKSVNLEEGSIKIIPPSTD